MKKSSETMEIYSETSLESELLQPKKRRKIAKHVRFSEEVTVGDALVLSRTNNDVTSLPMRKCPRVSYSMNYL